MEKYLPESQKVQVGDQVRVKTMPLWANQLPLESQEVIRLCVGKTFRVREIDEHGHVEIWARHGKDARRIATADILLMDEEDVEVVTTENQL
jgi:hypothetical protein